MVAGGVGRYHAWEQRKGTVERPVERKTEHQLGLDLSLTWTCITFG